ncbi:MAG: response regulator transcription factor [Alistipes sp.]|nr:response regulator transcription factor [Alistipes sp.]
MTKILLVEDDKGIVSNLTEFLTAEGYEVKSAPGQAGALKLLEEETFHLVLLDISLSDGNGFSVCVAVKQTYGLPVIFLTASGDEYSAVTGFELGADDYIQKPFRSRELVMRIKNILRLTGNTGKVVRLGEVLVDTVKGMASRNGKDLYLSALEYRLLLVFLNNRGAVLSRTRLLEAIWDIAGEFVNDNTLTVYIKRLREKIENDPQNPEIIKTVRGLGYKVDL